MTHNFQRGTGMMIHITLSYDKVIIKGHTESTVCSSISSIMYTSINALLAYDKEIIRFVDDEVDDCVEITLLRSDKIGNLLFGNMINCMKNVAEQYPKCVKITNFVQ